MQARRFMIAAAAGAALAGAALGQDGYRSLEITVPQNEVTIQGDTVAVDVRVTPPLDSNRGHRVQLLLDDVPVVSSPAGAFSISPVARGSHVVVAEVRDRSGIILIRSTPVAFHVFQASRLFGGGGDMPPTAPPGPRTSPAGPRLAP